MLGTNPQRLCKIRRCVFGSSAPEGRADGFDLRRFQVGQVYDVGTVLANLLLAEGWAVPIDVPEPALVIPLSKLSDKVVLVVDDDRDVRTMLNHLLAFAGFAVIEAANGGDALVALVRQAGPDHPGLANAWNGWITIPRRAAPAGSRRLLWKRRTETTY
jgi:hypothetical protein